MRRATAPGLTALLLAALASPLGAQSADEFQARLDLAEVYGSFAVEEKGNMEAFAQAEALLDDARSNLEELSRTSGREVDESLGRELEELAGDLAEQRKMARSTLAGVFPLTRLLSSSLFADPRAGRTWELVGNPDKVAVTSAVESTVRAMLDARSASPQVDVVVSSLPPDRAYENEALYIFRSYPRFRVRTRRELERGLGRDLLRRLDAGVLDESLGKGLSRVFPDRPVLLVRLRRLEAFEGDFAFRAESYLFERSSPAPRQILEQLGLCRDRREQLRSILAVHGLALLLAVVFFLASERRGSGNSSLRLAALWVPVTGFLVGRCLGWILVPMTSAVAPAPEAPAVLSFWWPALVGGLVFLVPGVVFRIGWARLHGLVDLSAYAATRGATELAVVLGSCAYLSVPLFLLLEQRAWTLVGGLAVAAGATSLAAATFRTPGRGGAMGRGISLVAFPLLGMSVSRASAAGVWLFAGIAVAIAVTVHRRRPETVFGLDGDDGEQRVPEEVEEFGAQGGVTALVRRTEAPPFVRFPFFRSLEAMTERLLEGSPVVCALVGEQGRGKTAAAEAMIEWIRERSSGRLEELRGACPEVVDESVPFAPFQEALVRRFRIDLSAGSAAQIDRIDAALDGLFDSVVPFAGLLFPPLDDAAGRAATKRELHLSIAAMLHQLAQRNVVLVFLDDIHWMDPASRGLLSFLLETFHGDDRAPVGFLLTSRDRASVTSLGVADERVLEIPALDAPRREQLLEESLGIASGPAREIVEAVRHTPDPANLFGLFRVVRLLAQAGTLVRRGGKWSWAEGFGAGTLPPLPTEFREAVVHSLERWPEHRVLLECAACVGAKFGASLLAETLEMPRLEILRRLRAVEADTGVISDDRDSDDLFVFGSSFVLEILRDEFELRGVGEDHERLPKIVREYHARVARALERQDRHSTSAVFEIANHYRAAGGAHAAEAYRTSLRAARAAVLLFEHEKARSYLGKAARCVDSLGDSRQLSEELERETLRLEGLMAHVEQKANAEVAGRALEWLDRHPEESDDLRLLAARTCYDAGVETRDAGWFDRCVRVARQVARPDAADLERAEALHFIGIAMPSDRGEERRATLREALGICTERPETDSAARALEARISNSLAENLSAGDPENWDEARQLFERRIELSSRPELRDLPGLARSHGGLGRLLLDLNPPDLAGARSHFKADLDICGRIGDIGGSSIMYSLLAQCDVSEGEVHAALAHYEQSLDFATLGESFGNGIFARCGIVECLVELGREGEAREAGLELAAAISSGGMKSPFAGRILEVVGKAERAMGREDWLRELSSRAESVLREVPNGLYSGA